MNFYENVLAREPNGRILNKSALLLALGIFLLIAPTPDAATLADLTQNFIVSMP